jgi:hypothetical protein
MEMFTVTCVGTCLQFPTTGDVKTVVSMIFISSVEPVVLRQDARNAPRVTGVRA